MSLTHDKKAAIGAAEIAAFGDHCSFANDVVEDLGGSRKQVKLASGGERDCFQLQHCDPITTVNALRRISTIPRMWFEVFYFFAVHL